MAEGPQGDGGEGSRLRMISREERERRAFRLIKEAGGRGLLQMREEIGRAVNEHG